MISTRSAALVIDTVVCLTLAKWETVSGRFGGYLSHAPEALTLKDIGIAYFFHYRLRFWGLGVTSDHLYIKTQRPKRLSSGHAYRLRGPCMTVLQPRDRLT